MRAPLLLAAVVTVSVSSSIAQAQSTMTCKEAFSSASEASMSGHLLAAREALRRCSAADCPSAMAPLCADDLRRVESRVPTVVFVARDAAGNDLGDVRVTEGTLVLQAPIDGRAIDMDPGPHALRFERPGSDPIVANVVVHEDEKGRVIAETFGSPPPIVPVPAPRPLPDVPTVPPPPSGPSPWAWIMAGVSVAALGTFGVAAALGQSDYSHLQSSCGSRCAPDQTTSVTTKFVVADVALAVGVVAAGLATWFFLRRREPPPLHADLAFRF